MRKPDIYIVYNKLSQEVSIVKSKRIALKIMQHGNKYYQYSDNTLPLVMDKFFPFICSHSIEKNNIKFCFEASPEEKSNYIKKIFERKII